MQEAFLKFVPSRPAADAPEQPAAYLYRIVRNLSLDLLRRKELQSRDPLDETSYWAVPRPEASPEQSALLRDDILSRSLRCSLKCRQKPGSPSKCTVLEGKASGHRCASGLSVATVHRMIHTALVDIAKRTGREQTGPHIILPM